MYNWTIHFNVNIEWFDEFWSNIVNFDLEMSNKKWKCEDWEEKVSRSQQVGKLLILISRISKNG